MDNNDFCLNLFSKVLMGIAESILLLLRGLHVIVSGYNFCYKSTLVNSEYLQWIAMQPLLNLRRKWKDHNVKFD